LKHKKQYTDEDRAKIAALEEQLSTPKASESKIGIVAESPVSQEEVKSFHEELSKSNTFLNKYVGRDMEGVSHADTVRDIEEKNYSDEHTNKNIRGVSLAAGALGVLGGLISPALIGTTPALAAALPAFMTSVVSVGGVAVASSLFVVGGVGLGLAALGYGAYKLRESLRKRKNEKALKAAQTKEINELF
jgi:hypothetical protein